LTVRYEVSPEALDDIDAVAAFLAESNGATAERFIDAVYRAFDRLAANPHLGHARPDLTSLPVFFWTVLKRYAVIYRKAEPLQIVRVLPWRRDVATLLNAERGPPARRPR